MSDFIERRGGEMTTYDTRHDAHESVNKQQRYDQIIECLTEKPNQTAKEIACMMVSKRMIPYADRNFTAPRLTEMFHDGRVEVVGKRECKWTHRMVSVYNLREVAR